MKLGILTNKWVKILIMCLCLLVGLYMLFYQFTQHTFDMSGNPWNARLYAILAFIIIAFGFAWQVHPNVKKMLLRFVLMFGVPFGVFLIMGGIFFANDASTGSNYAGGNVWVAFDALDSLEGVGEAAIMIANAAVIIIPLSILGATVMMVFYSDTSDDLMGVIIEGGVSFGFMAVYGFLGNYFGWIP